MVIVQCTKCLVWIPENESHSANELAPLLYTNLFPDHSRTCVDEYACARRSKDKVGDGVDAESAQHRSSE